ncbi:hypothetical protein [Actinoplanes subtropicus]|uniref:hypothetical protein n=1 Tax=Actinoplanes subtropicus TaxID=543632 RepID=UPI0004C2F859|nr:hypothetical protein [Actinoplanes subtropicus]
MSMQWGRAATADFHTYTEGGDNLTARSSPGNGLDPGECAVASANAAIWGSPEELAALGRRLAAHFGTHRCLMFTSDTPDALARIVNSCQGLTAFLGDGTATPSADGTRGPRDVQLHDADEAGVRGWILTPDGRRTGELLTVAWHEITEIRLY